MHIGFIGLGTMGFPIAGHLAKVAESCRVWNRTNSKAKQHAEQFLTIHAESIEELKVCDIIFTCLPTSQEVKSYCNILKTREAGVVFVDVTSGVPKESIEIMQSLSEFGHHYVDAPVSGGPKGAREGTLTSMVGGDHEVVEKVLYFIKSYSRVAFHVGPCGSGHAIKSVNNALNVTNLMVAAEGLCALRSLGICPKIALDVINASSGRSLQTEVRIPTNVLTRDFNYGFKLGLMVKDFGICKDLLDNNFSSVSILKIANDTLLKGMSTEGEDADYTAIVRYIEHLAGVQIVSGEEVSS